MKKLTLTFVIAVAAAASFAYIAPSRSLSTSDVVAVTYPDDPIPVCPPECGRK